MFKSQKAVKRFRRAADGRAEVAADIRPMLWLEKSMTYLWEVTQTELQQQQQQQQGQAKKQEEDGSALIELYDFVADRFQAIRKDMIVQVTFR